MMEFERKAYYSPKELAAILGVHRTTIDRYIREGTLRAVKLSARTYRIPLGAVLRLVSPEEIPPVQHPSLPEGGAVMPMPPIEEDPIFGLVGLVAGATDDSTRVDDVVYGPRVRR